MLKLAKLFGHRRLPFVVGNAEGGNADAAAHVNVFLAGLVIDQGSFAAYQLHREARIGICDKFLIDALQF